MKCEKDHEAEQQKNKTAKSYLTRLSFLEMILEITFFGQIIETK